MSNCVYCVLRCVAMVTASFHVPLHVCLTSAATGRIIIRRTFVPTNSVRSAHSYVCHLMNNWLSTSCIYTTYVQYMCTHVSVSTTVVSACAQVQAGAGPPGPHGPAAGRNGGILAARGQENTFTLVVCCLATTCLFFITQQPFVDCFVAQQPNMNGRMSGGDMGRERGCQDNKICSNIKTVQSLGSVLLSPPLMCRWTPF